MKFKIGSFVTGFFLLMFPSLICDLACITLCLLTYQLVSNLGGFHFFVMNTAAVNIGVRVSESLLLILWVFT